MTKAQSNSPATTDATFAALSPQEKALHLIRKEMREKTGILDLGNLGLTEQELPDELWGIGKTWTWCRNLRHLQTVLMQCLGLSQL